MDPELAAPADRIRPLGAGRWEIKAVIDDDCRRGLEQLKGLLSHVDPHMTLGQIVARAVREAVERHDPARPPRGRRTGSRGTSSDADETSAPKVSPAPEGVVSEPAQRKTAPTGGATSPAKAPADFDQRRAVAKRASVATQPSAPKDASGPVFVSASARPTGVSTPVTVSPAKVPKDSEDGRATAVERPETAARTETSAPKDAPGADVAVAEPARRKAAPPQSRTSGRAIPAAVKRQVWTRDQGCCSYVDRASGRRCGSRHQVQIDHVLPFALGGGTEPENLRLLCAAHHRHRHADRDRGTDRADARP